MRNNYAEALAAVLVHEGGYVNHPRDPGGATNKGITHRTYAAWLHRKGIGTKNIRDITNSEVEAIYKEQYWDVRRGDDLPSGVDYAVFDFAVNSGPARAGKFLQRIVGASADGQIGNNTLYAVDSVASKVIVARLCDSRLAWLKRLKHWKDFGRGWSRRVKEVRAKGIRLAETQYAHIAGSEASGPAQGKADGPITTRAAFAEMTSDPKAIIGAVTSTLPGVSTALQGDGPVQWGVGFALAVGALGVAFWLWQRGREDT